MSVITPHVVRYAAQECAWQQSGELSVAHMVDGWRYAHRMRSRRITVWHIVSLARIIEPIKNAHGMREVGVRVGFNVKLAPELVAEALVRLVDAAPDEPTEDECVEWFRQYEEIHPFIDGNGRTGSILYNWMRGSLPEPIHAPNLWGDPRRTGSTPHERPAPPPPPELIRDVFARQALGDE